MKKVVFILQLYRIAIFSYGESGHCPILVRQTVGRPILHLFPFVCGDAFNHINVSVIIQIYNHNRILLRMSSRRRSCRLFLLRRRRIPRIMTFPIIFANINPNRLLLYRLLRLSGWLFDRLSRLRSLRLNRIWVDIPIEGCI